MYYYQLTYSFDDGSGLRKEFVKSKVILYNFKQARKIFPLTSTRPAHLIDIKVISWLDYFLGNFK